MRSCASSSSPHSPSTTAVGTGPSGWPNASPNECAGSVLITSVRNPASAQRSAVAAAVVVLPTPPLPVKSRTLMASRGRGRLDVGLQLAQRVVHDLRLGPALHER